MSSASATQWQEWDCDRILAAIERNVSREFGDCCCPRSDGAPAAAHTTVRAQQQQHHHQEQKEEQKEDHPLSAAGCGMRHFARGSAEATRLAGLARWPDVPLGNTPHIAPQLHRLVDVVVVDRRLPASYQLLLLATSLFHL